jgi:hypothetical protein
MTRGARWYRVACGMTFTTRSPASLLRRHWLDSMRVRRTGGLRLPPSSNHRPDITCWTAAASKCYGELSTTLANLVHDTAGRAALTPVVIVAERRPFQDATAIKLLDCEYAKDSWLSPRWSSVAFLPCPGPLHVEH